MTEVEPKVQNGCKSMESSANKYYLFSGVHLENVEIKHKNVIWQ